MGQANRRLGDRKRTSYVEVEFGEPELVGRFRKVAVPSTGRLIDISVTGALVEAKASTEVRVGSRVRLVLEGMEGVVIVRQVRPTALDGIVQYGVAFFDLPHAMTQRVHELVGSDRDDHQLQRIWDSPS